ncbi:uncharacterized protein K444DRAFT_625322 [Hyaloscypha bicolor E]|uniref:Uncharacterized protein n=1 Tax=Hyaloscypha bicolor E TaxID=1095630 RepID=A0A2J6TNY0_9HELO|nr:uncharacterized protein K444DRAFT_625322 [Hyaloscypha bicolor E]PMD64658.1 hypothetical protein K444DRAFT_625322 [Hyaloscypha bicolor E]
MSSKPNSVPTYRLGSLPMKIKRFIEASSDTDAYHQRSHSHHSLLNAYMVATFLEEASQYVPPMKRDAGLRDLAQRLHMWPGDMAMQLQRDALKAINLLERYIRQSLAEELKFVERSSAARDVGDGPQERVRDMTQTIEEALEDLGQLKHELREQVLKHHLDFASTDLELHDLSPFIPGFTSARAKGPHPLAKTPESSRKQSVADLSASFNLLTDSGLSPKRIEALAAIENFRDTVNSIACDFADIIGNGSMKALEERVVEMANIQEAFERMGIRLYRLLNAGSQQDYEGNVDSAR